MAKSKTLFFCKECGHESPKWMGQCPGCKCWDTFVEGLKEEAPIRKYTGEIKEPTELSLISLCEDERLNTGITEFDRVLGGGIVAGSLILVGGDPGIGKSTLLLQVCRNLCNMDVPVLYISGEESLKQIKLRAERLGDFNGKLYLLCETNSDIIEETVRNLKPKAVVIDSIQTMYKEDISSSPGSVNQVREITGVLMQLGKGLGISIFIVGHVTKEGIVAGPRVLEHMVDTVLYFEGERHAAYRVLRAVKNRFGSTNELGVFEMRDTGLREVTNPSEYMLSGRPDNASGSAVTCSMEGTRPILVEVQALVCETNFNMPRRTSAGVDYNRVNLLMAVLEKHINLRLSSCDAYVNVAGGMKINEPALDLSIIMALVSSYKNRVIGDKVIMFGEVGLTGEVRAVSMAQRRVMEAEKLGFDVCILPKVNMNEIKSNKIKLMGVNNINEAIYYL